MSQPVPPIPAAGPLKGIKVLDFCSFIAGAHGAMLLGDMGAEVIKIEPLRGDLARTWGPFLAGESRMFQGWNRNKRSLAIDLRSPDGQDVIYTLARDADVVIENFRPGTVERLKIDYARLSKINPRLIYCSSSAFGSKGPDRDRPGYDPLFQSMAGAARGNVRYSGKVSICSVAVSDYNAAMLAVSGIVSALYHRERTGEGQKLETSLLQAIMSIQAHSFCQGLEVEEEGAVGIYPYRLFDTQDDLIFIAAPTNKFWQMLCEALDVPELGTHASYGTNPDRVEHAEELTEKLQPIFRQKTTAQWETILLDKGVPCAGVRTQGEFFEDPQVEAMAMNPVIQHSKIGPLRVSGVPVHFEKTPGAIQRAAPTLGEHTEEILREIGWDQTRIEELRTKGVIMAPDANR